MGRMKKKEIRRTHITKRSSTVNVAESWRGFRFEKTPVPSRQSPSRCSGRTRLHDAILNSCVSAVGPSASICSPDLLAGQQTHTDLRGHTPDLISYAYCWAHTLGPKAPLVRRGCALSFMSLQLKRLVEKMGSNKLGLSLLIH